MNMWNKLPTSYNAGLQAIKPVSGNAMVSEPQGAIKIGINDVAGNTPDVCANGGCTIRRK